MKDKSHGTSTKDCSVCGHPKRNHKKLVLHDPNGKPYQPRISCNCIAGDIKLGSILCGCDGKKALGQEMIKRIQLV